VKRTLKRESKVLETAKSKGIRTVGSGHCIILQLLAHCTRVDSIFWVGLACMVKAIGEGM
jgi:hypothetical protein